MGLHTHFSLLVFCEEKIKLKNDPVIPDATCPHIDHILSMLDEIQKHTTGGDRRYNEMLLESMRTELELVRRANELLRESSSFWYTKCKRINNNKDK